LLLLSFVGLGDSHLVDLECGGGGHRLLRQSKRCGWARI
jgi:hypothetical protein